MINKLTMPLQRLREWDDSRLGLPGEHWLSLGLGLFLVSRRPTHSLARAGSVLAGTALLARALSGRDGPIAALVKANALLSPTAAGREAGAGAGAGAGALDDFRTRSVQGQAMKTSDGEDQRSSSRGYPFIVEAQQSGRVWAGNYRLLNIDPKLARQAAEDGQHQWTSMNPRWATPNEARRNATEAAYAAIDALCR